MKVCGKTVVVGKLLTNPVEEDGCTILTIYNINFLMELILATFWYEGGISSDAVIKKMRKGDLCRVEGYKHNKKFKSGKLAVIKMTNSEIINR